MQFSHTPFGLQVGHGTYSNVYKARDKRTGKIVALKKVRFDTSDSESIKFMAREIMILQTLDHPNVIKLEGLATSRMQYSLYLVFEFMQSDLTRIISRHGERLTEAQVRFLLLFLTERKSKFEILVIFIILLLKVVLSHVVQ